jgi:hypothetical protein
MTPPSSSSTDTCVPLPVSVSFLFWLDWWKATNSQWKVIFLVSFSGHFFSCHPKLKSNSACLCYRPSCFPIFRTPYLFIYC